MIARRFRALGDPSRLSVLHSLEAGPLTVTELVEAVGLSQGNLSKHLQLLHANGLVARRREGLFVHYSLADDRVLQLCELMCSRLDEELAIASVAVRKGRRE
jgi:DNA-binding transcriptional ArsR family regulator